MAILIAVIVFGGLYGLWRVVSHALDREIQARSREEAPFGMRASESSARATRTARPRELYVSGQPHSTF